jgi:hypothetical protein
MLVCVWCVWCVCVCVWRVFLCLYGMYSVQCVKLYGVWCVCLFVCVCVRRVRVCLRVCGVWFVNDQRYVLDEIVHLHTGD